MPTDTDPKSTNEPKSRQGWFARCGIHIPALSVRDRRASEGDPIKPVMFLADSKGKKRKRASRSPAPNPRTAVRMEPAREELSASDAARNDFDAALEDKFGLEEYETSHQQLLKAEDSIAWDRDAKDSASDNEKRAAIIIRALREYERDRIFGNLPGEALPPKDSKDMGGQFLTNKKRIENRSKLYKITKELPKGGVLHLHFNAELHPERLLERARDMPNMYVRSIKPLLDEEDLEDTEIVFSVQDPDQVKENVDIFAADYEGTATNWKGNLDIWMPWKKFRRLFTDHFPRSYRDLRSDTILTARTCAEPGKLKLDPAENWIKQKMVLSEREAYDPAQTVNGVWARFNQATRCFKGLLNYEEVYRWYIGKAIDRMIEENVMYAELRPMLLDKSIPTTDGKGNLNNAQQMKLILEEVAAKKAELEKRGELYKFPFGLKIIYCTPRSIPKAMMQREMRDCLDLKVQYPDLICGFDLVGAEDRPNHIGFYREELVAFQKVCRERNLSIPFLFHAGETLLDTGGSKDPSNSNLFDAVALNAKRIGHGYSLLKHPHLIEKFKKSKADNKAGICIELCPISNELLHLCRNIKEHPYPELLAAGVPCTVNSDNPSLFSNSMSHEFYQIMVGAPTITIHSWKQLAQWSLEYSCLEPEDIKDGLRIYNKSWEKFCKQIVNRYGRLMDGDKINEDLAEEAYCAESDAWEEEGEHWKDEDTVLSANSLRASS